MIVRLTGRVAATTETSALLDVGGGIAYEVLVPRSALDELAERVGAELTLHTFQYLEGSPAGSNFIPRLLGFLSQTDREFFVEFTRVKGVGMRKALRAMALPAWQIAAAIERGDERTLTALPEIGRKLAAQICNELRGKLGRFLVDRPAAAAPLRELSAPQRIAVEILTSWGDRRADAERLVAAAVDADSTLQSPEEIVRAAYRIKQGATT